jgi:hypothetical protein
VKLVIFASRAIVRVAQVQRQPVGNTAYTIFVDATSAADTAPFGLLVNGAATSLTFVTVDSPYSYDIIPECVVGDDVNTCQVVIPAGRVASKLFYGVGSSVQSATTLTMYPAPKATVMTTTPANKTFVRFDRPISAAPNTTTTLAVFFHSTNYNTDLTINSYQNGLYYDVEALLRPSIMAMTKNLTNQTLTNAAKDLVVNHIISIPVNRAEILGTDFPDEEGALSSATVWLTFFVMKMIYELKTGLMGSDVKNMFEMVGSGGATVFETNALTLYNTIAVELSSIESSFSTFAEANTLSQSALSRSQTQNDTYANKIDYLATRAQETRDLIATEQGKISGFSVFLLVSIAVLIMFQTFYEQIIDKPPIAYTVIGFGAAVLAIGIAIFVVNNKA